MLCPILTYFSYKFALILIVTLQELILPLLLPLLLSHQIFVKLFQNTIKVYQLLSLLFLLYLELLNTLLKQPLFFYDVLFLYDTLVVNIFNFFENSIKERHPASYFIAIVNNILQTMDWVGQQVDFVLKGDEGLAVIGLLLHDWFN